MDLKEIKSFRGNKLQECRERAKKSRMTVVIEMCTQYPKDMAFSVNTLASWESGITYPDVNKLSALADYYGKPVGYFFN